MMIVAYCSDVRENKPLILLGLKKKPENTVISETTPAVKPFNL